MADQDGGAFMSHLGWDLAITASRALDADERNAVLGDLAEANVGGRQALWEVCGLVLRHQAELWGEWRPWLLLLTVVGPLSLLLSIQSRFTAGMSSVYLWMYLNNFGSDLLHNRGFWYELPNSMAIVFGSWLRLACWSWMIGLAIGFASKRAVKSSYAAVLLALLLGLAVGVPLYHTYVETYLERAFFAGAPVLPNQNDPVSEVPFYRSLFPWLLQLLVVAIPAVYGLRHSSSAAKFTGLLKPGIAILTVGALAEMSLGFARLWFSIWIPHFREILQYVSASALLRWMVYWPVFYVLVLKLLPRKQDDRVVAS